MDVSMRTVTLVVGMALACANCQPEQPRSPPPIVLSVPGPEGQGSDDQDSEDQGSDDQGSDDRVSVGKRPVEIRLRRLSELPLPSMETVCAGATLTEAVDSEDGEDEASPENEARSYDRVRGAACLSADREARADALSTLQGLTPRTREGTLTGVAAHLESIRLSDAAGKASWRFGMLASFLGERATVLGETDLYAIAAEVFEGQIVLCPSEQPNCRPRLFTSAAKAFVDFGRWRSDRRALDQAIDFLRRARGLLTPRDRDAWIAVHNQIGNAFGYASELAKGAAKIAALKGSAEAYEALLPTVDERPSTQDWAMVHHNLGTVFEAWSGIDDPDGRAGERLDRAIAEFEKSLTVWTRSSDPEEWASANDNLGRSVFERGRRNRSQDDMSRGLDIHRAALAARAETKAHDPLPWAYSAYKTAWTLIDRAALLREARPEEEARRDRAEARALLDSSEPTLIQAKSTLYLGNIGYLRGRLAAEDGPGRP